MTLSSTNTHRRALGQQGKQHGRPAEIDPRIFTRAEAEEARGTVPPLPRVIVNTSAERKAPVRSAGTGRATGAGSSQSCTPDFTPRACGQIVLGSVWQGWPKTALRGKTRAVNLYVAFRAIFCLPRTRAAAKSCQLLVCMLCLRKPRPGVIVRSARRDFVFGCFGRVGWGRPCQIVTLS